MIESSLHVEVLIERGLTLYENGDVDNAVLAWENALQLEPSNARANGYVDYVRLHYQVLSGASVDEAAAAAEDPFGVSTSAVPEYRITIAPFGASPLTVGHANTDDGIDEGWFLDPDGVSATVQPSTVALDELAAVELQLEAPDAGYELGIEQARSSLADSGLAANASLAVLDELEFGITAQRSMMQFLPESGSAEIVATVGSIGPTDNAHRAADADQRAAKTVGERATTVAYGEIDTRLSENPLAPLEYGTAPFDTVIAASQRDDMSVAVEPEVFEYEADEPASDSYSASYADDLDASFGIVPHASTAQAATGDTGHSVNRSADDSAKHDVDENVDDDATADDSDVELTVRSGVPRPQVVPWAAQPLGADALGEFESEGTGVLQRENGFVAPRSRRGSDAPQVHMSLRTPTSLDQVDLDDVDEASGGVPDAPLIELVARTPSRPTSQLSGLVRGPMPARVDLVAPVVMIPEALAVATGRGRTRSDLFPVKSSALLPPATGGTQDLSQRASLAVAQCDRDEDSLPELVIESLEPSADDSRYDQDPENDEFNLSWPVDQTVNLTRAQTEYELVLPFDPIAAGAATLLHELDATAPRDESRDAFVRRRITGLLALASDARRDGDLERTVTAIELALSQAPESALGQKLVQRHRDEIFAGLQLYLGDMNHNPRLAIPMNELGSMQISPRAAFLVSRIDGGITYDELLDVAGMPRMEALRYLCQMVMRGVVT